MANGKRMLLVLLLMACGIILALWHPVWLAPPLLYFTDLIYSLLGLAWLPLLLFFAVKYPLTPSSDHRLIIVVIGFGGMLLLIFGFGLLGAVAEIANPLNSCDQNSISQAITRYSCHFAGSSDAPEREYERIDSSPFVQIVTN